MGVNKGDGKQIGVTRSLGPGQLLEHFELGVDKLLEGKTGKRFLTRKSW